MSEDISKRFEELIGEMTDNEFWEWSKSWVDEQLILDIAKEWDDEIKKDEIKNMERIIKYEGGTNE